MAEFWRRCLDPLPREAALPVDLPYPARPAGERRTLNRPLDPTADEATLLAAYVGLLHRYGGGHDITVGYDGLPVRVGLDGGTGFTELVRRVAEAVAGARAHRAELGTLAAWLRAEPTRGGGLLFNTAFRTPSGTDRGTTGRTASGTARSQAPGTASATDDEEPCGPTGGESGPALGAVSRDDAPPLDLVLEVAPGELWVSYRQDLFETATARRIADHYVILLADALARPHAAVGELELMSAEERRLVLEGWNDTEHALPRAPGRRCSPSRSDCAPTPSRWSSRTPGSPTPNSTHAPTAWPTP